MEIRRAERIEGARSAKGVVVVIDVIRAFTTAARAFASAEEFLRSDVVDRVQCLLLDIAMPGLSGPELQQELQQRRKNIPVVFITAHQEAGERILSTGVECLIKPFSERALEEALHVALGTA